MTTVKDQDISFSQIERYLSSAAQKIKKARRVISIDEQTGFQMAYDAMLRISLGFMLSHGKRPRSTVGHHKVIIEFVAERPGLHYERMMKRFDSMRRKRNEALYEPVSSISHVEAQNALTLAETYLTVIRDDIKKRNPQQNFGI